MQYSTDPKCTLQQTEIETRKFKERGLLNKEIRAPTRDGLAI